MVRGSRRWVLPVFVFLALPVLLTGLSQPASACSLAQIEFDEAVWVDQDRFVATFGFDVVLFDMSDGMKMSEWGGGVFHRLAGDPLGDRVAVKVQEGLGGDCSGDVYLDLWDQGEGERVERIPGLHSPLSGSAAGILAGHGDLLEVSLFSWETLSERRVIETGLPDEVFDNSYRYALAYPDDGRVLVALPQDPPSLYWVSLDPRSPGVWHLDVAQEAFDGTPNLAFEPAGDRLALLFTSEGRDRVVLLDMERPEEGFEGLLNVPVPEGDRRPDPVLAWTEEGIAVVGGDRVRHVNLEGDLKEVVLEQGTARNVVASPFGSDWTVLVEDHDGGHQVIRYIGDGVVTSQWRYTGGEWDLVHPSQWSHLSSVQPDDPSWGAAGPVEGGPAEDSPYVPGPGPVVVLVGLALVVFAVRRRRS